MRKSAAIVFVFCLVGFSGVAQAQKSGTGVGAVLGDPTGFSFKHWIDDRMAIDAAAGWSFERGSAFHLHSNWLWHDFELLNVERGDVGVFYGVGARFKSSNGSRDRLGVRFPIGLGYYFEDRPLEIFGEIAPIMDVVPSTRLTLNASIGFRWYFW